MADEPVPTITAQAVERAVNPATGTHDVRVRLRIEGDGITPCEWSIWVPNEDSFERAFDLAREELHRISSQIAASGTQKPDPSTQSDPGESERERKWRENQERSGPGWVV